MSTPRFSVYFLTTLVCLSGAAQAQGPWPTMNPPTVFSPVREFFTPRSYTSNDYQPMYSQSPSTPIIPGVPQCANGRCRQSCPNGQCSQSNHCANGQCGPGVGSWNSGGSGTFGMTRSGTPNSTFGLRPLTTSRPNSVAPRSGNLNRLIPLDSGSPVHGGSSSLQTPMYRHQQSMAPQGYDDRFDPGVRLQ
jgi:hypothetical protein